jgi:diadenosine tetraphosphate (Ap4A) HIT family hydrolase
MQHLFGLLRSPFFYAIFIWILNHIPSVIPVKTLREMDSLLAFFHPRPEYTFHVILLPKKAIRSFSDLEPADPFLADVVTTAQSLVAEKHLTAYRLTVNGGAYQEFPHLHFHLISGVTLKHAFPSPKKPVRLGKHRSVILFSK